MTSSIPELLAWPVLACFLVVIGLRLLWHNTTQFDVYFNIMLCLMAVTQVLGDPFAERFIAGRSPLDVTTVQQLSLCSMPFECAEFLGVIVIMAGAGSGEVRRRHVAHRASAAVLAAVMFAAGSRARHEGLRIEVAGGWDEVVVWAAFCVLPVALSMRLLRLCVHELTRTKKATVPPIVLLELALVASVVGGVTFLAFVLATLDQLGIAHTTDFRVTTHSRNFFWTLLGTMGLAAGPCVSSVVERLGLDERGRAWRKLLPLWSELTSEFAEVIIPTGNTGRRRFRRVTAFQLHRTAVEIRDAILRLKPHMEETSRDDLAGSLARDVPAQEEETALRALQIAKAFQSKRAGERPTAKSGVATARSQSRSLEDETAELIRLAKWWKAANEAVASSRRGRANQDQEKEASAL